MIREAGKEDQKTRRKRKSLGVVQGQGGPGLLPAGAGSADGKGRWVDNVRGTVVAELEYEEG